VAINLAGLDAPMNKIASDLFRKTPTNFENNLAVVAFKRTVPKTTINTKGVMYSAPSTPCFNNLLPNKEAIPAATIPLGHPN
jgi:hypothetical protein